MPAPITIRPILMMRPLRINLDMASSPYSHVELNPVLRDQCED